MNQHTYDVLTEPICPSCQTPLSAAIGKEGRAPSEGDLTVCLYCGTVLQFEANLTSLTAVPAAALDQLPTDLRQSLADHVATVAAYREVQRFHSFACEGCDTRGLAVHIPNVRTLNAMLTAQGWQVFEAAEGRVVYVCAECRRLGERPS